jgi:hypothetical protein
MDIDFWFFNIYREEVGILGYARVYARIPQNAGTYHENSQRA